MLAAGKYMKHWSKIILYLKAYLPPIIWASLIFFLSNQNDLPGVPTPVLDLIIKQSAHVFVYGVLHFLIQRAIQLTTPKNQKKALFTLAPIVLTLIYALTDEYHQSFIPGREATWIDIGFDTLGIMISHYLTHRQKQIHSFTRSTK